mmetsp:Transcript_29488/g.44788  ORF Transcript_29488/g.44788 Transcript_29488/m.44788 type:complete len:121 (+) Transcript_29488:27-389(+)
MSSDIKKIYIAEEEPLPTESRQINIAPVAVGPPDKKIKKEVFYHGKNISQVELGALGQLQLKCFLCMGEGDDCHKAVTPCSYKLQACCFTTFKGCGKSYCKRHGLVSNKLIEGIIKADIT